ncbi:MAG: response regulator [Richelia sp. SM2_1_7]|nr:response regulator [Richelia sp. SM2_1_7]
MALNSYSILLLETNQNDNEWLQPMLLQHQVTLAQLSEAKSISSAQSMDAVILNLRLSNIQDFEIISSIRELLPNGAILVISENEDDAVMAKAIESGVDDFICKIISLRIYNGL